MSVKKLSFFIKSCIFLTVSGILTIICLYTYAYFSPKIELKSTNQYYIYDKEEKLVHEGSGTNEWIGLKNISPNLINAVISIEMQPLRLKIKIFINIKDLTI